MSYGFGVNQTQPTATTPKGTFGFGIKSDTLSPSTSPFSLVHKMSPEFGGGAFNYVPGQSNTVFNTGHTTYAGEPAVKGKQRDDIIPVALGGANSEKANIRSESLKGVPGSNPFAPNQGTDTDPIEKQNIANYKSGKISLAQARLNVLTAKQQQMGLTATPFQKTPAGQFLPALGDVVKGIGKGFTQGLKDTGTFSGEVLRNAMKGARSITQLAATPVAALLGALDKTVTAKQTAVESLNMALKMATDPKINPDDSPIKASQMYLQSRGVGKYGGKQPSLADIGVLSLIGFGDLFGDPVFQAPAAIEASNALKEFATWKKVGTVVKDLPEGSSFVNTISHEIPISNDLKIKIIPQEKEVVFKGYARRFPTEQPKVRIGATNNTTPHTGDIDSLVKEMSDTTGLNLSASVQGDDLVLKALPNSTVKTAATPFQAIHAQENIPHEVVSTEVKAPEDFSNVFTQEKTPFGAVHQNLEAQKPPVVENPVQYYHGTASDFNQFDTGKQSYGNLGKGVYITDNPQAAKYYSMQSNIAKQKTMYKTKTPSSASLALNELGAVRPPQNETPTPSSVSETTVPQKEEKVNTSKVAQSIETKSIEQGLTKGFSDVAGYDPITIKDQAKRASDLMNTDMDKAIQMVKGEIPMASGLRGEMLIKAMEDHAQQTGNVQLLQDIANSPLVSETSAHAQAMRLLAERNPESAVAKLREIKQAREKAVETKTKKSVKQATKETTDTIKKEIKKAAPKKEDWDSFVSSIICS